MTVAEYKQLLLTEQRKGNHRHGQSNSSGSSKYKNVKVVLDGLSFDSKAEARRYEELKSLRHSGAIISFARQPSFVIVDGLGKKSRYVPDFIVCDKAGHIWVEDVKGIETQAFKLKKRCFEAAYPYLKLLLVRY